MARVAPTCTTGLLILSAIFLIGPGCSHDAATNPGAPDVKSLAQGLNVPTDGSMDYPDGYPWGVWQDGFEDYVVGGDWPSTWAASGNAPAPPNGVVDDVAFEGSQSLRLYGVEDAAWAGGAYRALDIQAPFEIRVAVYNGDEDIEGPYRIRGVIGLSAGNNWTYPWRTLVSFWQSNEIVSSGGHVLGTYNCLEWYQVRIRYERLDEDNVRIRYWINHQCVWVEILPVRGGEDGYSHMTLEAWEGSAWFDNVEMCTRP